MRPSGTFRIRRKPAVDPLLDPTGRDGRAQRILDSLRSEILDTAEAFRQVIDRPVKKVPTLRGKTVANMFYEPSTRTKLSFELAEKRLTADSLNFSGSGSALSKGETLIDTAMTLNATQGLSTVSMKAAVSSGLLHHMLSLLAS